MADVDLALLPAFVAVAELGSFSAAAQRLGVQKSSVSRSIARLESAIDTRLVHRTTRRVTLSAAGTSLYETIIEPMAALRTAIRGVGELDGAPTGHLRVTAPVDLGSLISESVARFNQRYRRVEVELSLTSALADLVGERFDVALRVSTRPLRDSSLYVRSLGELRAGVFASPLYLARHGVPKSPDQLAAHEWVVFSSSRRLRLFSAGKGITVATKGHVVCDDMFFVLQAVRHGIGVGLLPRFLAEPEVRAGNLVHVVPAWDAIGAKVWLMTQTGRKASKILAMLVDCVEATLSAHHVVTPR